MCSCPARSIWLWPRPSRACGATPHRAGGPSPPCSRPARESTCRCSSTWETACAWTRGRVNTCLVRRSEQRRAAIWALYQGDLLGQPVELHDAHAFTRALTEVVREHQSELDELIRSHATGWSLERIAPLDRSILRVGLAEMR